MKTKQVVVVRRELNMRMGKAICQGGHGFMDWLLTEAIRSWQTQTPVYFTESQIAWFTTGNVRKIALQTNSEEDFHKVYNLATDSGLNTHMVVDSGLTEFHGVPTKTVISIGPNAEESIDKITGPNGLVPLKPC